MQPNKTLRGFVATTILEAQQAESRNSLISDVMSTKFQVWKCRKCGANNPEWVERCAYCERRR